MRKVFVIAIALILLGVAPLLAADSPRVVSIPRVVPATGGEVAGALTTFVTVGLQDPAGLVPCFYCVPGSMVTTLGLSLPLTWVPSGSAVEYVLVMDDYSYSGAGNFIISIRQGYRTQNDKEVYRSNVATFVYASTWIAYFPTTLSLPAGRYTLLGEFDAGGSVSVVTAPLVVQ